MKEVSDQDKLFYFEKSFFTLDGLWIIEAENFTDFETALRIDKAVWQRLLPIVIQRIKKYLKIETNSVGDIVDILSFRWSCEGWEYDILKKETDEAVIHIKHCPYKAIMDRSEGRQHVIRSICKEICVDLYKSAVESFNPEIKVKRDKQMGLGSEICDFHLRIT